MSTATERVLAAGTRIYAQGDGEGSAAQVAAIVSISGPEQSAEQVDLTELDPYEGLSTQPAQPEFFKLFLAGWRDAGQVTLSANFTQGSYARVKPWFDKGLNAAWYIQTRLGTQFPFTAFISGLAKTFEQGDLVKANITLKITGKTGLTTAA